MFKKPLYCSLAMLAGLFSSQAADYAKINFQTTTSPGYTGYLADTGATYATRNGFAYGWNADNSANSRDRSSTSSLDARYATFNHLQKNGTFTWEIAVPNGTYTVKVVSGDADYYNSTFKINVEGVLTVDGTPTATSRWVEGTRTVTVSDGRLTISNGAGASNNKICFVDIATSTTSNNPPAVSLTNPASGSTFSAPASVALSASASDSDGTVSNVQFYAGTSLLGTDSSNPYAITWSSVPAGSYSLTARATDNGNATTTSAAVNVAVTSSSSTSPACGSASSGPKDNPVAAKYGATTYPWTDSIKWACVFNINDYAGSTIDARFNSARDAASAAGGGVVYFPSGSYNFADSIHLKNGVVIRGENPASTDAKASTYNPPSKLVFPKYNASLSGSGTPNSTAFKYISTTSTNTDSNIGLVNLDINRAFFKVIAGDASTQNNQNILVLGVRNNNVAEPDPGVPTSWQNAWQRWCYRFSANVKINAKANVLVANNRINDAMTDSFDQPGYKIRNGTNVLSVASGSDGRFNYGNHYGLDINRGKPGGYALAATPTTEPTLFRTGIVVRDNYVYHTMRIAVTASGQGLIIKDNIIRDQSGKTAYVDPTGTRTVSNSATLENRAIDWSGYSVVVEGNDYEVQQHLLNGGPYFSVDGEGILLQECCGGSLVNGVTIRNNKGPRATYIGLYKTRDINNALIEFNTVNAATPDGNVGGILVQANTNGGNYAIRNGIVRNNSCTGMIRFAGEVAGSGNAIQNNVAPSGAPIIRHSCEAGVSISGNSGFTVQACE